MSVAEANRLTDRDYWDHVWSFTGDHAPPPRIDCAHDLHQALLDGILRAYVAPGARFLEIGCGGSAWPAHAAAQYQAEAWGIDFSTEGLALARACAARDRVKVELVDGDLFDRARLPAGRFDVVYSGGFVEHFPAARPLMERIAELLAPQGVVITSVPNLDGVNGILQHLVDRDCFERHLVFTPETLDAAHACGGLRAHEPARYLGVIDLGSVNFSRLAARLPVSALKVIWAGLSAARRAGEAAARHLGAAHGGRWLSPMLVGVYGR